MNNKNTDKNNSEDSNSNDEKYEDSIDSSDSNKMII